MIKKFATWLNPSKSVETELSILGIIIALVIGFIGYFFFLGVLS